MFDGTIADRVNNHGAVLARFELSSPVRLLDYGEASGLLTDLVGKNRK